jgi:alanine dehydrogenase
VLLGGAPGVRPGRVVVLGAGTVGSNAAWIAQGMEAEVILIDRDLDRLRVVDQIHRGRIMTLASSRAVVERSMAGADLVIGAILVPGGRAPVVATEDMVRAMQPGTVIVDVAVDQGGCIETTVETTHEHPVVERYGVLHYGVGNIPAAVPHTSTYALTNATFPYALAVADRGALGAAEADRALAEGVVTAAGRLTNPAVADALGQPAVSPFEALGH